MTTRPPSKTTLFFIAVAAASVIAILQTVTTITNKRRGSTNNTRTNGITTTTNRRHRSLQWEEKQKEIIQNVMKPQVDNEGMDDGQSISNARYHSDSEITTSSSSHPNPTTQYNDATTNQEMDVEVEDTVDNEVIGESSAFSRPRHYESGYEATPVLNVPDYDPVMGVAAEAAAEEIEGYSNGGYAYSREKDEIPPELQPPPELQRKNQIPAPYIATTSKNNLGSSSGSSSSHEQHPEQKQSLSTMSSFSMGNSNLPVDDAMLIDRHAVAILIDGTSESAQDFCTTLESLRTYDIIGTNVPVLIFYEDGPDTDVVLSRLEPLRQCTMNPLSFHSVNLEFPEGFDPDMSDAGYLRMAKQGTKKNPGRKLWGYSKMIRFWTTLVWHHPAVAPYKTIMRLDTDSCFVAKSRKGDDNEEILPGIKGRYVYRSDEIGVGINTWVKGLMDFAKDYMQREGIIPSQPSLWNLIQETWETQNTLPIFHKNFEVSRVSFFLRDDVTKWHAALTEQEPFGVFRHRWSDANTRVFTMAMFAQEDWILLQKHDGYRHGKGFCDGGMEEQRAQQTQQRVKEATQPQQHQDFNNDQQTAQQQQQQQQHQQQQHQDFNNDQQTAPQQQQQEGQQQQEEAPPLEWHNIKNQETVPQQQQQEQHKPSDEAPSTQNDNTTPAPYNLDIPHSSHAIVTLIESDDKNIRNFCYALQSLHKNHIIHNENPILIFHEDTIPPLTLDYLRTCTTNPLSFHVYDTSFPPGFDPAIEAEQYSAAARQGTNKGPSRESWSYTRMIRFWTTGLWKLPFISQYRSVMRFDTDSCFVAPSEANDVDNAYVPGISPPYFYRTDGIMTGVGSWTEGLYDFAVAYMTQNDIVPANPSLWNLIEGTWKNEGTLPVFSKNFEVVKTIFFLRPKVMQWHEALTEREPFGVMRKRWSDAHTRVFTMAMFADEEALLMKKHPGYRHGKHLCKEYLDLLAG